MIWRDYGTIPIDVARLWHNYGAIMARLWRDYGAIVAQLWRDSDKNGAIRAIRMIR